MVEFVHTRIWKKRKKMLTRNKKAKMYTLLDINFDLQKIFLHQESYKHGGTFVALYFSIVCTLRKAIARIITYNHKVSLFKFVFFFLTKKLKYKPPKREKNIQN